MRRGAKDEFQTAVGLKWPSALLQTSLPRRAHQLLGHSCCLRSYFLLQNAVCACLIIMRLTSPSVLLLAYACINVGGDSDNQFIFPTAPGPGENFVANLVWTLGSTQKIQYTTNIESYHIALYHQQMDAHAADELGTIHRMLDGENLHLLSLANLEHRTRKQCNWRAIFRLDGPDVQFGLELLAGLLPVAQLGLIRIHLPLFQHH